jgi:3-keto steroid reductase
VEQLCDKIPKDALPQFKPLSASAPEPESYDGLTIIMACRNKEKAMAARTKLLTKLDDHIEKLRSRQGYDGHAERFRKNLEVNFHKVDMADVKSVFDFAGEVQARYVRVSCPDFVA